MSAQTATVEPLNMDWAALYVGGKGLLFRYMWEYVPPRVDPWAPENPLFLMTGSVRRHQRLDRLAPGRRRQEPDHRHPQRQLRGRLVRARDEVRRLRRDHRRRQGSRADGRHHPRRRCRVPAGRTQVLGAQDLRDRAGPARRLRPRGQDPVDRPGRRDAQSLGLPVDRPVPQGRQGRSRRPHGLQEPQGHRPARHRQRDGGRRQGLPRRHGAHPQGVRAHRRQPLGPRDRHAGPRRPGQRRRRHSHAQLVRGLLRRHRHHQLRLLPEDPRQEARLLPVRHRAAATSTPPSGASTRSAARAPSTRPSPCAAPTAASATSTPS